jgi:Stress responsive A/B Barrel Domain
MIRHCVMFKWSDDATAEQRARVPAELATLPALIPALRAYHFGSDLGMAEGNYDFVATADFDDVDGYHAYAKHPEHVRIVTEHIRPVISSRAAVQFAW